jgi:hypothetical protein
VVKNWCAQEAGMDYNDEAAILCVLCDDYGHMTVSTVKDVSMIRRSIALTW